MNKNNNCVSDEIALKSFFLGPQSENGVWVLEELHSVFSRWMRWRKNCFPQDGRAISELDQTDPEFVKTQHKFSQIIDEVFTQFEDEVPKFSPRYIGHMFSEISLPALFGHMIAVVHNPNNISSEASRVGQKYESEAIEFLGKMVGFEKIFGHFCSGGTVANFECLIRARERYALWLALGLAKPSKTFSYFKSAHMGWDVATKMRGDTTESEIERWHVYRNNLFTMSRKLRERNPDLEFNGPVLILSKRAHYSWKKGARFIGLSEDDLWCFETDSSPENCSQSLRNLIEKAQYAHRPILCVVTVAGTTEFGNIDPVHLVADVLKEYCLQGIHIWHHVDGAYGGFFRACLPQDQRQSTTTLFDKSTIEALYAISNASSVTLDPHKLGYVPFSSGTFLCKNKSDYAVFATHAPYIDIKIEDKWMYTLEGSRSASGAVATWMTAKVVGLDSEGLGKIISRTIHQKLKIQHALSEKLSGVYFYPKLDTNILCFVIANKNEKLSQINAKTMRIFNEFSTYKESSFYISKTSIFLESNSENLVQFLRLFSPIEDVSEVCLIRLCIMNPFMNSREMKIDFVEEFVTEISKIA